MTVSIHLKKQNLNPITNISLKENLLIDEAFGTKKKLNYSPLELFKKVQ
jgi:hypothetical protein